MDIKPKDIMIDSEIVINPRLLHRELTCPICLDILNQTMTTRECLHRFCSGCINKALRSGNKECPTCRKKLTSRRCLRPDPNFDQLISKLYIGENEKVEERSVIEPECEMILRPLQDHETARFIKCPHSATIDHLNKYLAMRPKMFKAPEVDSKKEYNICLVTDPKGIYTVLFGDMKLHQVKSQYNLDPEKPLELYYYIPSFKKKFQ